MDQDKEPKINKSKKTATGQPANEIDPHPTLDLMPNATKGKASDNKVKTESVAFSAIQDIMEKKFKTGYYTGLSKSTKEKRRRHFARQAAMSHKDPQAYEKPPGDNKETRPSKYTKKYHELFGKKEISEEGNSLADKARKSGIPLSTLRKVYNRGLAAWRTGHRPGASQHAWAHARVNSYITKGKTYYTADADLHGAKRKKTNESVDYNLFEAELPYDKNPNIGFWKDQGERDGYYTLYHGTHEKNVPSMMKSGIDRPDPTTGMISTTPDPHTAHGYAAMSGSGGETQFRKLGNTPVNTPHENRAVLKLQIPKAWADRHIDPDLRGNLGDTRERMLDRQHYDNWKKANPQKSDAEFYTGSEVRFSKPIPSEFIVGHMKRFPQGIKPAKKKLNENFEMLLLIKKLDEVAGVPPLTMDQLVRKFMGQTDSEEYGRGLDTASYTKVFSDAMRHYIGLLKDGKNKGRPWDHVAKDAVASFPDISPYGLFTTLKELLGIGDAAVKNRIVDESRELVALPYVSGFVESHKEGPIHTVLNRGQLRTLSKNRDYHSYIRAVNPSDDHLNATHVGYDADDHTYEITNKHPERSKYMLRIAMSKRGKPYHHTIYKKDDQGRYNIVKHHQIGEQTEPQSKDKNKSSSRFDGTNSLVKVYSDDTPGQKVNERIIRVGNKFRLVSKKTGRNLGTYPTRAGAEKRERQVQYFKHAAEEVVHVDERNQMNRMKKKLFFTLKSAAKNVSPEQLNQFRADAAKAHPGDFSAQNKHINIAMIRAGRAAIRNEETLNKPQRTPGGPKKFMVKVRDPKTGNVKTVRFGDPNMEIKRDDPKRRKSFRARHHCDTNPGPKTKARYWSCRQWRSGAKVEG